MKIFMILLEKNYRLTFILICHYIQSLLEVLFAVNLITLFPHLNLLA